MQSLLWAIFRSAIRHPKRVAVVDDQRTWTYGQLLGGALHLAERLDSMTGADRIGVLLPTGGAFPMTTMAAWWLNKTLVPINYLLSESERQFIVDDSGIDTVITVGKMLEHVEAPKGVRIVELDKLAKGFKGLPALRMPPVTTPGQLAVILYTSGTSGRPKGVMLTHSNLLSNVRGGIRHAALDETDGFLGVLPQFHSFGLTALTFLPLVMGAKVAYTARFVPRKVVKLIREHRPQIFVAIPSMYNALLTVKDAGPEDFKSVQLAVSGGEPLPQAVFDGFLERFGVRICEGYGLTETSPGVSWCTPQQWKAHSVGKPFPGVKVKIVDDGNHTVPADDEGEVLIKGPNIMQGYFKHPELTAKVIDEDGYFRTGDWGKVDGDGFLYITGRKKEMLIIGGENVFPREIEEVLNRHPSIQDSAVIGKMDPVRGELPIAFVELAEDAKFDEGEVRNYCREGLAGFKVPREVHVLDALPRNPTGKILRRDLKA